MNQHPAYELFEELGRGANTVVYRSYDLSLGREVAIKELDENSRRDPRQRDQFLREAQFLAQFEHDNVLRVYSVDPERGWIVMELMKGTLASIIAAGPSDPDLVRSVLKQTLDALAFLHEKNKVHGTVRPTNLLINDAGRVKLSEFEQTAAGGELRAPKGSKKYLAPELIKSEFGGFGPALDLYCLGFTALEMLKGPQFEGLFPGTGKGAIDADIAWLRWHSSPDDLASTKKLVKNIPDDLAHVLDRMLKKQVADRPQSAQEVLKELADKPLVAVPIEGIVEGAEGDDGNQHHAPGVVRTISAPPTAIPRGVSPAMNMGGAALPPQHAAAGKAAKAAKAPTGANKPAPASFSKEWFNQQLGRPYVLYPLCALIILAALWASFGNPFGGSAPAPVAKKETKSAAPKSAAAAMIPVTFNVQPDDKGLEVLSGADHVKVDSDNKYPFSQGHYSVTFNKEGFTSVTRDIDVSPTSNNFDVKLDPIKSVEPVKPAEQYVDVVVQVTPPNAELKVAGKKQDLVNGAYTHKLQEGQPLQVEAQLDKYVSVSRSISADELKTLGNRVTIALKLEKPQLPASLTAKPGAPLDPVTKLPSRVLASRLGNSEPLELALVAPGNYTFGVPDDKRRAGELTQRAVLIDHPYYIAIHETTDAQYQKFFEAAHEAKAGTRWQASSKKWATPQKLDPVNNQLPVTNVSIEQASAFCNWVGGQLPTEIEWECAVRGSDDKGFPYPWGKDEITRDRCRIFNGQHLERGEGGPVPVDQLEKGANELGMTHALGNVAEWCLDSDQRGGFILRGCSIATANINDVRVTWRAQGDAKGEESTGFRVIIPITNLAVNVTPKTTGTPRQQRTAQVSPQPGQNGAMPPFTWDKIVNALTSPSTGSGGTPAK